MKRLELVVCILLSFSLTISAFVPLKTSAEKYTSYLNLDFSSSSSSDSFSDTLENIGTSWWGSMNAKIAKKGINGKTLVVNKCDIRNWSMSVTTKDRFFAEFKTLVDSNYNNTVNFCLQLSGYNSTGTDKTGGCIIKIVKAGSGEAQLVDRNDNLLAVLSIDTVYDIVFEFALGSDTATLYLNNDMVSSEVSLPGYAYKICGLRLLTTSDDSTSYISLDDIMIYTTQSYAQQYSAQAPGTVQIPELPEEKEDKILFYHNTTQITSMTYIELEDSVLYLRKEDLLAEFPEVNKSDADSLAKTNGTDDYIKLSDSEKLTGAKIWWDYDEKTVVFTDKDKASEDILRSINGKFYMNGEPYYEISFNKFDLAYQIGAEYTGYSNEYPDSSYTTESAEEALKELHEGGFKTIRIFAYLENSNILQTAESKKTYYEAMDKVFDLCDKYDIQVVASLGFNLASADKFLAQTNVGTESNPIWVSAGENTLDLISDSTSKSREILYSYIEEFVGRYKDRKTILMWEIGNECNLEADIGSLTQKPVYSLLQLSNFYKNVTSKIKSVDTERLVTGGDSVIRSYQWHAFLNVMKGESTDCVTDSYLERLYALALINNGLDVISSHCYNVGKDSEQVFVNEYGSEEILTFERLMSESKTLGLPFYNGETNGVINCLTTDPLDPSVADGQTSYLNLIIESGVQLTHWWSFHSDRYGFDDDSTWSVTLEKTPYTFNAIKDANQRLKETYMVNALDSEGTATLSEKTTTTPVTSSPQATSSPAIWSDNPETGNNISQITAIITMILLACTVAIKNFFRYNN